MSINNPYQIYQQNSMNTASPGELTLMLYNGAIKKINIAKKALQENRMAEKNEHMISAQDILKELMSTLNMEYEISQQMMQMYDYMLARLIEANISNDVQIMDEVQDYFVQFRDTWKEVIQVNRKLKHG